MQNKTLNKDYWDNRYQTGNTAWDIGAVSTPLKEYIDQLDNKNSAILIPGCGNAYEAAYLLQSGFNNVTLIDISATAVEGLKEKFANYSDQLNIIQGDFFELQQEYDLILEQTFFCAIDPSLRKKYVEKMYDLLKKDGKLAGLFFNRSFDGGPPFGGNKEEYMNLLTPLFNIVVMDNAYNSITPRKNTELFVIAKKVK